MKTKKKKTLRMLLSIFLCLCILGITALTVINSIVKLSTGDQIITYNKNHLERGGFYHFSSLKKIVSQE